MCGAVPGGLVDERGARLLRRVLAGTPEGESPLTHAEVLPARDACTVDWPAWAPQAVVDALRSAGIKAPWSHQVAAADAAWHGSHVVLATGTASGKSLAYHLPVLSSLVTDRRATALYLSPTKALAADQLRALSSLGLAGVRAAAFDGDTPLAERDWVRAHARWVFTNPDMLHRSILPAHGRWASWLRRLRYVVIDECHTYRGVFGSHVALLLRRLRRVAARYGATPVFVLASATTSDPCAFASVLTGLPVVAVTDDGSPRGARTVALWEPPLLPLAGENGAPVRRSAGAETARLLADLVVEGARTIAFVRSRRGAELTALGARRLLSDLTPGVLATPGRPHTGRPPTGPSNAGLPNAGPSNAGPSNAGLPNAGPSNAGPSNAGLSNTEPSNDKPSNDKPSNTEPPSNTGPPPNKPPHAQPSSIHPVAADPAADLASRVAAYRAGYLPEERRALEHALATGELLGVASTNALELGVDIAGLDAVVVAGYPGTVASFWQQAGRAGRSGDGALVIFVARDDPLDTYLVHHPRALLGRPLEACVLDPANPYVLEPQLACAAAELPLTETDVAALFGPPARDALDSLVAQGYLRRRATGWFWAVARERPHGTVDIRGSGGEQIVVVENDTGRMLGTIDPGSAHTQVHPGAVYLHQGRSYLVDALELDESLALVHAEEPSWNTSARELVDIAVTSVLSSRRHGEVGVALGEVEVTSQVVGYLRRLPSGEVLDQVPLDLPPRCLRTRAVWYTVSSSLLSCAGLDAARVPGALHAAEHAAIGLLPLFAVCDRWDIGGVSTALHPDTGEATVFVHDGHPGGAGFADRGHAALRPWLAATRDAIAACECPAGCPSCVQSPKCGNGNDPLDKRGAVLLLDAVLAHLAGDPNLAPHLRG